MASACPSFTFSCSNISCSIWFCYGGGGSNKEPEKDHMKQYHPPPPQVIAVPDHLKQPSQQQQPPEPPPAPPPAASPVPKATVHACSPANPPHHVPSAKTYYPQPPSTPQQPSPQTLLTPGLPPSAPAPPPKVHDPWALSSQIISPDVQYTMMHKPPPQPAPVASQPPPLQAPWPASHQPCKAHQALSSSEKPHLVPPHLPFRTYQAPAPPAMASPESLPPGPLDDSTTFMGYYPQEHPEYFVHGS